MKKTDVSELKMIKTDEHTISSGHLDVGNGHKVYYEEWGNPKADTAILMFHGGPGGSYKDNHKYSFDPIKHRVIAFDQRGSGNSLPYGELKYNTTEYLIVDAIKILDHLKLDTVNVYGGSWGSTLALLFAIEQPQRVKSVIVTGVFTGSRAELDYVDKGHFIRFYPEVWERFVGSVPEQHAANPAEFHYAQLQSASHKKRVASAKALEDLESPLLRFDWQGYDDIKKDADKSDEYDEVSYLIYAHYMSNNCFLPESYVLNNAHRIKAPLYIVQGRYDMVCPPITAYTLHKAVAGSELIMTLGSHGRSDPETRTAIQTLIKTVF